MKKKLFTHTDLDGVACAIVAFNKFGYDNVDVEYCDYHTIDEKVNSFGTSDDIVNYDAIYITDISVNQSVADALNMVHAQGMEVVLLDHHESANWLNKYEWAHVHQTHEDGLNTSGTSMFFDFLNQPQGLYEFVELVRRYDTWDWYNIHNDLEAKRLNDLFWLIGRDRFIKKFHGQLQTVGYFLTEQDLLFLEIEQEKINRKVAKALKQLTIKNVGRYNIGVVFAEQYMNDIAHQIHQEHPHLDLIAVINVSSRKISYRTERDDIDVGQFAKYFGGGGRPQTAGSQIGEAMYQDIINLILY